MSRKQVELIHKANEELLVNGNLDAIPKFFSDQYQAHGGGKDYTGLGFVRKFARQLRTSIEDLQVEILIHIEKKDSIAWQRTVTGRHVKNMRGIPASDRRICWRDMIVTRFEGNLIIEDWLVSELAGELMLKQPRRNA